MDQALRAEKLISGAQITNVAGAGGTVGLPQFVNQWKGRPNALMVGGMVMVGAIIANKTPDHARRRDPDRPPDRRVRGDRGAGGLAVPDSSPTSSPH